MQPSVQISESEFHLFQKLIFEEIGITLSENKKILVQSRLQVRVQFHKLNSFRDYLRLVQISPAEKTEMLNRITTNETYFFREPVHYEFLKQLALSNQNPNKLFRIWSAAASVGVEAYSAAMIMDSFMLYGAWEILATDINTSVLQKARIGLYPERWIDKIPKDFIHKYCLKGKGNHAGKFLIDRKLLTNLHFEEANLLLPQQKFGLFDVIFLRNVLLYFNMETKQRVLDNLIENLVDGGYLFISQTENLNMLQCENLIQVQTSIYRKQL